jgi:hypothetical protein
MPSVVPTTTAARVERVAPTAEPRPRLERSLLIYACAALLGELAARPRRARTRKVGHGEVRRLFFRALGLAYVAAFRSMRVQVRGLYGARGIAPVHASLELAKTRRLRDKLRLAPTLLWIDDSDDALDRICRRGEVIGLAMALGGPRRLCAAIAWVHYLSLVAVGRPFLSFQWDALLLETGAHAIAIAGSERRGDEPTWIETALMRWLLFRLHFESGVVKWRSPDTSWRERTALERYYETAPLPTVLGWWAQQLPPWFHHFSTWATVAIECGAPVLLLGPRRLRHVGAGALTFLQLLIAATGNYGFFNALAIALHLFALDDRDLGRRGRIRAPRPSMARIGFDVVSASVVLAASLDQLALLLLSPRRAMEVHSALGPVADALAPYRLVSSYGPFSVMTNDRLEIEVEGSDDGERWEELHFRYKPDDVRRRPRWVAPHQPRLDWQMWFAALRDRPPSWFLVFLVRVLEGAPEVLALLESNPFSGPPRYVRATIYRYEMTTIAERRATGCWWSRKLLGAYVPPITLGRATHDD